MGHRRSATHWFNLFGAAGLVLAALAGCSGDDGPAGPAGSNAVVGGTTTLVDVAALSTTDLRDLTFSATESKVDGVTIASAPKVTFTLKNANGRPVAGFEQFTNTGTTPTSYPNMAFSIAKLVPGTAGGPSRWVSYIVTSTSNALSRPTTDNTGSLVYNGNGSYTYTFQRDIAAAATTIAASADPNKGDLGDVTYEPNRVHRVTIQIGGTVRGTDTNTPNGTQSGIARVRMQNPINLVYDFIPATGQPAGSTDDHREVVQVSACFGCHSKFTWHGGAIASGEPGVRQDTRYCVMCHTDQRKYGRTEATLSGTAFTTTTYRVNGQAIGNLPNLVHKIHRGAGLTLTNYNYAGVPFNEVTYPQDTRNCTRCHVSGLADSDAWTAKPSRLACGACHDNVDFATGVNLLAPARPNHSVQTDDSLCATCHNDAATDKRNVAIAHVTANATTNNPSVPTGAVNFTYEISGVTVASGTQPVITFRILRDGTPVTFDGTTAVLSGFTGAPSFVIAYAVAQDGVTPAEYTNYRSGATSGGQPQTVSLNNLTSTDPAWTFAPATSYGTLSAPDASGYYTATITAASREFPAGSTMRAIGLQGYFTQSAGTNGIAANTARHAVSVTKAVTGDTARRSVVDNNKCANCHEWLELHGGNRVVETGVCVMCHNPNLSSSGRTATNAPSATTAARLTADGYDPNDASTFPEATNNFKNMIHGIHAEYKRTNEYRFVRNFNGNPNYYNWSEITFPGILKNCETCHKTLAQGGGYDIASLPAGTLASIDLTTDGNAGTTVATDRSTVPNALDLVTTPIAATCVMCHDTSPAKAHMVSNGGYLSTDRTTVNAAVASGAVEQCLTCHGPGKVAAIAEVHAR